jgi:hypothetical protein
MAARLAGEEMVTVAPPADPVQRWETGFETGVLWRVTGSATPLTYTVAPQILTVKTPMVGDARPLFGGDFVVRGRYSLLIEPILQGPEHHYYGGSASGSMEWWNRRRSYSVFFAAGGGVGWLDSKGHAVAGAQGEDFNFNWLAYPGMRWVVGPNLSFTAGAYFQHVSNGHLNKVNPGLNAVGPMLGAVVRF